MEVGEEEEGGEGEWHCGAWERRYCYWGGSEIGGLMLSLSSKDLEALEIVVAFCKGRK